MRVGKAHTQYIFGCGCPANNYSLFNILYYLFFRNNLLLRLFKPLRITAFFTQGFDGFSAVEAFFHFSGTW